jgi:hypothetical protein
MTPFVARRLKSKNYLTAGEQGASEAIFMVVAQFEIWNLEELLALLTPPAV